LKTVNPKLLIALVAVVALALVLKLINPHKKYSTRQFGEGDTVASVPDKALKPGNQNGKTALDLAREHHNATFERALLSL
jgi:hypothetical protein